MNLNPREHKQIHTHRGTRRVGGGEGAGWSPSLEFLMCCSILKRFYFWWKVLVVIFVYFMGGGAAGGL